MNAAHFLEGNGLLGKYAHSLLQMLMEERYGNQLSIGLGAYGRYCKGAVEMRKKREESETR